MNVKPCYRGWKNSRKAEKNSKLKRIMSVSGSYGLRNYTVKDLQNLKGKKIS